MCADDDFFDFLRQESHSEGPVAWLEKRWGIALASIFTILCILVIAYFFGLPFAAEHIASHIPMQTEQSLGWEALSWLDNKKWFSPTTIDPDQRKMISDGFNNLCDDLPLKKYYRLEFRSSKMFGPNALALPGGTIVITDNMVNTAQGTEELMAVLAHEIGHVELRHTMRNVLQNSVVAIAAAALTSDAASLGTAVAGLPALLAQAKYSRKFESDADEYSFQLLKQKGLSPEASASIMERLAREHNKEGMFVYISSHPETESRIKRARAAAKN